MKKLLAMLLLFTSCSLSRKIFNGKDACGNPLKSSDMKKEKSKRPMTSVSGSH
jgi:hypothetical protein